MELVTWLGCRQSTSLDGEWNTIVDPYDAGYRDIFGNRARDGWFLDRKPRTPYDRVEYNFDASPTLSVPGDWSSQREDLHWYEGIVWYRRRIDVPTVEGRRQILHVGAANRRTRVFCNGEELATHTGGHGPFCVELTGKLKGDDSLILQVDATRTRDGVPGMRTDWWNHGGITGHVQVLDVPATFIRDAVVQLAPGQPNVLRAHIWLDGPEAADAEIRLRVADLEVDRRFATNADGFAEIDLDLPLGAPSWSPDNPRVVAVVVTSPHDEIHDSIGLRTIAVEGTAIVLNGEPVFLRGISLHDEAPDRPGRCTTDADARTLLGWAKDLGCNFVRLAHYQHPEAMVRLCDELGFLVWAEIPVYWGIDMENEATLTDARSQITELVVRDRNRASVILWSVANETLPGDERNAFLRTLIAEVRVLDPSRLVTAALFAHPAGMDLAGAFAAPGGQSPDAPWAIDDPLGADLDVLGVNEYLGWYYGDRSAMRRIEWQSPWGKPLVISEMGADAQAGRRGDDMERWTEEFQAAVYVAQLEMISRIPFLAGVAPWILKDFRTPLRPLPGVLDGWNRKGLVSNDSERKLAFTVLREFYENQKSRSTLDGRSRSSS
jgi:beta-glucuronidase